MSWIIHLFILSLSYSLTCLGFDPSAFITHNSRSPDRYEVNAISLPSKSIDYDNSMSIRYSNRETRLPLHRIPLHLWDERQCYRICQPESSIQSRTGFILLPRRYHTHCIHPKCTKYCRDREVSGQWSSEMYWYLNDWSLIFCHTSMSTHFFLLQVSNESVGGCVSSGAYLTYYN